MSDGSSKGLQILIICIPVASKKRGHIASERTSHPRTGSGNTTQPLNPPGTTNDHFFSCTSYSVYYTQELNTEIVDDAKFERQEEEPGAGQTNSRKNSRV